ncbi:hypothetical protein [Clostridioides sp. ZZV14-6105]
MNKKVLIISTSFRRDGNSEILADMFLKGAKDILSKAYQMGKAV